MSHHTAPTPLQAALPPLCMAALPSPICKGTLVWLNYHTYFKKQRGNLYGSGTITCKTTIPNPRVKNRVKNDAVLCWYTVLYGAPIQGELVT
jgi:hypothetical protein